MNDLMKDISKHGYGDDVKIFKNFDKESRIQFLKSLTLLSVPVPSGEAFGTYQVEALAAGVPVVQPNVGCYPEFVDATNGGIIYEPNDSENLAKAIISLLEDPDKVRKLGEQGRKVVLDLFSMNDMAENMIKIYKGVQS